ncbi:MAG TPA: GNAT family acetyltransferase [Polyangia bacterium]
MGEASTDVVIRSYVATDRAALESLWSDVFPDDPAWNAPSALIERKLTVQPELLLVATTPAGLVGAVMAGFDGVRGWLHHLAVSPGARRQGIATRLIRAAEAGLQGRGCTKVNLQVRATNPGVVSFYRRLGYDVEDRISMGRSLSEPD